MDIHQLLREQDGLITRDQARAAGLTDAAIDRRLARREWDRVRPTVLLSAEHRFTDRARVRADSLWLGPDATLVGVAAAWWWRLIDDAPQVARFAVSPKRRIRSRGRTMIERPAVPVSRRIEVDGVIVTTRARTVVDAARELGIARGADLVDRALLDDRVTFDGLREAHAETVGRWGSPTVARLLRLAAGGARFEAERRLHGLWHRAGIRDWIPNHRVDVVGYGEAVLDIAFPEHRVIIEIDGWASHCGPSAFRRDRRRQNALVVAGWTVLRVTWHDVVAAPDRVLAEICAALTR